MFRFYLCRDCDFRFVDPVTGPEIYDADYYAGRGVDPLVDYEVEYKDYASTPRVEEFRGLAELVEEHFTHEDEGSRQTPIQWLDFGCGAGGLLKYLRDRRTLTISGVKTPVDPSGSDVGVYVDRLRQHDCFTIYSNDGLSALPHGAFDVVSLIEVIEHIERPLEVLSLCSRLLRPSGVMLLTTGNLACPLARWQGVRFAYCIPEIHVSLWTPKSLVVAYRNVGLLPRRVRCDGSMRFKISKNLAGLDLLRAAGPLWHSRPVMTCLDWLYGISRMPMAVKPRMSRNDRHASAALPSSR